VVKIEVDVGRHILYWTKFC